MKISTKGRYGLRALVDLEIHSKGDHIPLCNIAERQGISENYLEQVFSVLRKAGIVKSIKGAQGGYFLADQASNISVGDVLRSLEGDLSIVNAESAAIGMADQIQHSIKELVWDKMTVCLNRLVDSITLKDLAEDCKKRQETDDVLLMYYI